MRRRLVARRTHLVKQRTRLKNQVHAILSRNLVPTCPHADLFSAVGRRWLFGQDLPADEWRSVEALVRQLDFHGEELAEVERDIAVGAIDDARSEEHTSELQSLMRISYAVFCLK